MKNTGKRLILVSFVLAVVSSVFIFIYLKPIKTPNTANKERTILVAIETIAPRTVIEKKMVKEIQVPDNAIFADYIVDSSNIVGKYTKETILKDEGFHKDKLLNELNNELSLKIEGNNRGISINVNGSTGVSDLIKQGDFVDIIVYLTEKKDSQKIIRPDLSKILLQNIQVLAIDKVINRDDVQRVAVPTNYLVTLSVPIFDIEKLTLAEDTGTLKLVLRPLKPDYIHKTEGATWQDLILDNSKEMRNLFPEYKIKPAKESKVIIGDYKYKKYVYYKIKQGDTLRKISETFYGDSKKYVLIKQVNGIWEESLIKAGTGIKIPVLEK
ncbi:Flp pilus assembly protein CpaB [Clostridium algoriphilum]|uniref:Flp pilus assembly protein CpaB n=1 Tax=Clostridium algoriphilum TaxID=198347 RepID=UPI001CF2B2C3|nr:Flp pilus assembly protein CpaB [Clostridium algoriphilum]MCB2294206.1 Flp pilus assembly protein CpaB [Clostridium algoriphilum]